MTRTFEIKNGDVVMLGSGRPNEVEDLLKAKQDVRRLLSIEVISTGEGAGLEQEVGEVPDSTYALSARVQRRVRNAVRVHQILQARYQQRSRTADELLARIARLLVVPAELSGRLSKVAYVVRVDVLTATGERVGTSAVLT